MKDYYQILGVRQGASLPEIKRAYRVLVQRLHPDVNPEPVAHELIKDVNEAYDVLSDDTKRRDYDYQFANPYLTVEAPIKTAHRDPRYRRSTTYSQSNVNRGPTEFDLMQRVAPYALKIFQVSALLSLFLAVDFFLPLRVSDEIISSFKNTGSRRYEANYLITRSGQKIKISTGDGYLFEADQKIQVFRSRILNFLIEVNIPDKTESTTNLSTIYANFKFVPLLLGIFSILGLVARGKLEFRFNLGIVTFFVLIFTVLLMIK